MNRIVKVTVKTILCGGILFLSTVFLINCSIPNEPRYKPSKSNVYVPESQVDFSEYVSQNRSHIEMSLGRRFKDGALPFGKQYPLDFVVNEISLPFELQPIADACTKGEKPIGFLILHGLFGTPGSMRNLAESIQNHIPCSLIRAPLMSGHGTVPADALDTRYQEWQKMTAYAVGGFEDQVSDLFFVGFSTGAVLALDYVQNPDQFQEFAHGPTISGFVFLSPAFYLPNYDHLSVYLNPFLPYLKLSQDRNPYRYDSIPINLGAQIDLLAHVPDYDQDTALPVIIFASEDDSVIDFKGLNDFFCRGFSSPSRKMSVYPGMNSDVHRCKGISVHKSLSWPNQWRMMNFSHESLYHSADHPFYGYDAFHKGCRLYESNSTKFEACLNHLEDSIYGAYGLYLKPKLREYKWLRIGGFNPFFDEMVEDIITFVEQHRDRSANDRS